MHKMVLALEDKEGNVNIAYAHPHVEVLVTENSVFTSEGGFELYNEESLRETGTLRDFLREVDTRRNMDKREGLIGR